MVPLDPDSCDGAATKGKKNARVRAPRKCQIAPRDQQCRSTPEPHSAHKVGKLNSAAIAPDQQLGGLHHPNPWRSHGRPWPTIHQDITMVSELGQQRSVAVTHGLHPSLLNVLTCWPDEAQANEAGQQGLTSGQATLTSNRAGKSKRRWRTNLVYVAARRVLALLQ